MELKRQFDFLQEEQQLEKWWRQKGVYHYEPKAGQEVYAIDTPPPTVSGKLHMGHVYSYCQTDIIARYWRMRGRAVFYPMGYDDNGLPTERLVEGELSEQKGMDRQRFAAVCTAISQQAAGQYQALWRRMGLSVDWRQTYHTNGSAAHRLAQGNFIELYKQGLAYRQRVPALWCSCCQTAIAQADTAERLEKTAIFQFDLVLGDGRGLPVSTQRPELLPACVAVGLDPADPVYCGYIGQEVVLPGLGRSVPLIAAEAGQFKDGVKGALCCTFANGDDIKWWRRYDLPTIELLSADGRLNGAPLGWKGVAAPLARRQILGLLAAAAVGVGRRVEQMPIEVHDRCGTQVGYRLSMQWFVRVLDFKEQLLAAAAQIEWQPAHMEKKFRHWVEGLAWDWCISRQRRLGVPMPLWYCTGCDQVQPAAVEDLPVDPSTAQGPPPCRCGGTWRPDTDVMDTWATSSLSFQLATQRQGDAASSSLPLPLAVRPLGQEIIRSWVFYSLVQAQHQGGPVPWRQLLVSGWGLAKKGGKKLSKSNGAGQADPVAWIERYSADALRLWAASSGPGKDAIIAEERIRAGAKFLHKVWNAARFAEPYIAAWEPAAPPPALSVADRWILARLAQLIQGSTALLEEGQWAAAKSQIEVFFWRDWADHYVEMVKKRLYEGEAPQRDGALYTLYWGFLSFLQLLAPFAPFRSEAIYQALYAGQQLPASLHQSLWPTAAANWHWHRADAAGNALMAAAALVRGYKSEKRQGATTALGPLAVVVPGDGPLDLLQGAASDLAALARSPQVTVAPSVQRGWEVVHQAAGLRLALPPDQLVDIEGIATVQ